MHFDGKMLPDITNDKKVDRLPIIASQSDGERILRVPKLEHSTGKAISDTVYEVLDEFDLLYDVEMVCFDTEAKNTGKRNGAGVLLERRLDRSLLFLPCRHHIFEIPIKYIFIIKVMKGETKNPNIAMFDTLKNSWNVVDKQLFTPGIHDEEFSKHCSQEFCQEMLKFCTEQLEKEIHRDDYRELLELVVVFLGGKTHYVFKKPGATHHARWMAKAIYSLKIFLLRDQLEFDDGELDGLRDVCVFLIRLYVKAWFKCTSSINAPQHDLTFIQDSINYASVDKEVSDLVLNKISSQLWYLSEEAIGFAFFDHEVSNEVKRKMVLALKNEKRSVKRLEEKPNEMKKYKNKHLNDFVSANTMKFFERLQICTDFLNVDPSQWTERADWQKGYETCKAIRVVNDVAERGVKLFTDYNNILTKDEEQKQFIVKVVKDYNEKFPSHKRSSLMSSV